MLKNFFASRMLSTNFVSLRYLQFEIKKTSRCDQHPTSNLETFGIAMAIYVALKATC